MTKTVLVGTLMALVVAGSFACGSNGGEADPSDSTAQATTQPPTPSVPSPVAPPRRQTVREGAVRVINKDPGGSGKYEFDPSKFTFNVGQTVTFALVAETEFHTFTVDELGIDMEVNSGETKTFTFTFDKAGVYKLICIPHEALGMVGEIVVQ